MNVPAPQSQSHQPPGMVPGPRLAPAADSSAKGPDRSAVTESDTESDADIPEWPQVPVLEPHHFLTEPMESEHHLLAMLLFFGLMKDRFADRDDVFVGADLACYFSDQQVRNKDFRAPDGIVVLGVEPRERQGWVVWEEGGRLPDLVVEHMSPSTRRADLGRKRKIYDEVWKVREYYAFDLKTGELHAFHRVDNRLEPAPRNADGHVDSPILRARVGVATDGWGRHPGPFLRLFDTNGQLLLAADERAAAESARAAAESARAAAESARVAALEAEIRALKARLGEG